VKQKEWVVEEYIRVE
jgi:hypothetical protein